MPVVQYENTAARLRVPGTWSTFSSDGSRVRQWLVVEQRVSEDGDESFPASDLCDDINSSD